MSSEIPRKSSEISPEEKELLEALETSIEEFVKTLVTSADPDGRIPPICDGSEMTPEWTAVVDSLTQLFEGKEFPTSQVKKRFADYLNRRLVMSHIVITDKQEDSTLYMTEFTAQYMFGQLIDDALDNIRGVFQDESDGTNLTQGNMPSEMTMLTDALAAVELSKASHESFRDQSNEAIDILRVLMTERLRRETDAPKS